MARDILLQAERLSELIQPIDRLAISLPASPTTGTAADASAAAAAAAAGEGGLTLASLITSPAPLPLQASPPSQPPLPAPLPASLASSPPPLLFGASGRWAATEAYTDLADGLADGLVETVSADERGGGTFGSLFDVDEDEGEEEDDDDDYDDEVDEEASLIFVGDVLLPVADLAARLAPERGVDNLFTSVDGGGDGVSGVRAPEAAVREAVTNLIDNALKYSQRVPSKAVGRGDGSTSAELRASVAIGCGWDARREMVVIEVWSSGAALAEEELSSVLEWGERGRVASEGGIEGTGLGLPIADQLVALLGGSLELTNAPMPAWAWNELNDTASASGGAAASGSGPPSPSSGSASSGSSDSSWAAAGLDDDGLPLEELSATMSPPGGVSARIFLPRATAGG